MAQDKPYRTASDIDRPPMYMGKTIVVMSYSIFLTCGAAAALFAWMTAQIRSQGRILNAPMHPNDAFMTGAVAVLLLAMALVFLLAPTLWDQFPNRRPESTHSLERSNQPFTRHTWKFRKEAFRNAPISHRRLIRFCQWAPLIVFLFLIGMRLVDRFSTLPSLLIPIDATVLRLTGQYGSFLFLLPLIIPLEVVKGLLMRRAVLNLERENRRRELHPDTCPDCDYPIDPDRETRICPECGFERREAVSRERAMRSVNE